MKYMKIGIWAIAAIVVAGFIFTGCSNGDTEKIVTVTGVAVSGGTLDKDEIYLLVGESEILTATITPENATDKTVTWKSSDTEVASVSDGEVTGVADGIAIITATTHNGRMANCLVIVGDGVTSVTLDKTAFTLELGKTETLTATVLSATPGMNVFWSSNDTKVATVTVNNATGVATVTALAEGTANIYATMVDGKRATSVVTVLPSIGGMVWINPGTFMMGSPLYEPEGWDNETLHQVTLTKGFYMGKFEVTLGQYVEVMGYNPSYFYKWADYIYDDPEDYFENWESYPADSVTWYDALDFCNKLSEMEGLTPAYTITSRYPSIGYPITQAEVEIDWDASGYRLPTEAEWEYACRAGTTGPFNFFNEATGGWGTDTITSGLDGQANFAGDWYPYNGSPEGVCLEYTTPVGWYAPNEWGLYDMHGNLYEWCWGWFESFSGEEMTDPKGSEPNWDGIVLRGGCFYSPGEEVRSAYRNNYDSPGDPWFNYFFTIGFRVVRPYSELSAPTAPSARILSSVTERSGTVKMPMNTHKKEGRILPEGFQVFDRNSVSPVRREAVRRKGV
jgi:formylglycine-generating enzyme required for sulfatase activity